MQLTVETKGKVERMVDYVKDNFLLGRTFADLDHLNALAQHWLDQTANVRIHATTGQSPADLFAKEKEHLIGIDSVGRYHFLDPVERTVNWEAMIHFAGSRYSVPPEYAGQKVWVAADGRQIFIRQGETLIAEHNQAVRSGQCIVDKEHLSELWKVTHKQIPPPESEGWQVTHPEEVQQMNLELFEEVSR